MALNFPTNPQVNQTYTSGDSTWIWNGTAWNVTFVSTTETGSFGIVTVSGQQSIVADSVQDTLNIEAGTNVIITTTPGTDTITINSDMDLSNVITITADDLSEQQVDFGDTIKFVGGSGIETAIDEEGNVTINNTFTSTSIFSNLGDADTANLTIDQIYEPAIAVLRVDNVGTSAYTFNSHYTGNNPNLYALAGTTIAFHLSAIPDLPFEIQDPTGNPFNTGLVHVDTDGTISTGAAAQGKSAGTLYWRIPESISGTYRYECQLFPAMFGVIVIKRLSVI